MQAAQSFSWYYRSLRKLHTRLYSHRAFMIELFFLSFSLTLFHSKGVFPNEMFTDVLNLKSYLSFNENQSLKDSTMSQH